MKKILSTPAPRWMVLVADTVIVLLCCLCVFVFNSHYSSIGFSLPIILQMGAVILTYLFTSLIVRSYQYIIRLSVIEDMYRLVLLVSISSLFLILSIFFIEGLSNIRYIGVWNIIIIGVFSFSVMMSMRLGLKYIYTLFASVGRSRKSVIVLGSAINSYVLANALKNEVEGRFYPVALLSLSDKKADTVLNGIPIIKYDADTVKNVFEKYNCDTLLFLSTQMELMRSEFADIFFKHNIKLLMLNQVEEFDSDSNEKLPNLSTHVKDIKIEDLLGREIIHTDNPHISQLIKEQVVMITGAAGSIGSEIVRQVASLGAKEIVLVDQAETPMHEIQLEMEETYPSIDVRLYIGDITNYNRMETAFERYKPRYVFHAAAYKHVPMMERNPSEAILTNVFGTKNIADLSLKHNVDKFVMISTDKAVNPTNIMGASKRIAEIYVQSLYFYHKNKDNHTRFITTRFGNVLGSNGSVIPRFRSQIEAGGPVTVTHKDIIRYFMTIPEACQLVLEAGCMGRGGEIYIFDMGKPIKIYDLACRMISLAGLRVNQDIKIVETGLRPGEKLFEELLNDKEQTIATHHKKIMIAKVQTYKYEEIIDAITRLYELIQSNNQHDLVLEMKHIVPEYHSQNSEWENIDKEIINETRL
ncbi:MAG: polysaccharide biosynthesis protein [Muribaculaceae bacterium]|nr:polysaccharide biosynthesis protein [Muribaculaceae bacterium]